MAAPLGHRVPRLAQCLLHYPLGLPIRCSSSVLKTQNHVAKNVTGDIYPDDSHYPPIKPKFPEGSWGYMDCRYAWVWNSLKYKILEIPNVQDRLQFFLENDAALNAVVLKPVDDHPACLPFYQFVTKTHLMPWEGTNESIFKGQEHLDVDLDLDAALLDEVILRLKESLSDHIYMESDVIARDEQPPSVQMKLRSKLIFRCISDTLYAHLGKYFPHLRTCQYDEDAIVRAFWDRYGLEREKKEGKLFYSSTEDILKIISELGQRVTSECTFDAMLRSHLPLPQIEPRNGILSTESEKPKLLSKLKSFGYDHTRKQKMKTIVAGHKHGDPCEFGLIGFLSTIDTLELEDKYTSELAQNSRLAMGLKGTFTWLASQACNQGFNHVVDLTYPLTSQTVLSDGHRFSFLMYQLNTLELWKDDEANKTVNLCWHTQEQPLYHSIENGQVKEFNEDVLKQLVKMFMFTPSDRGYDMKPTVVDKEEDLHLKQDFVPQRVIPKVIIEEEKFIV